MKEESDINDLNNSNKDTFLNPKESKQNIIKKSSELNRMNIHQTVMIQEKIEEKTLDDLGTIEEAKKHKSANKPLHKIKKFNSNVNFCRCCNLPCEEKGIIEPFHFCDDIDNFAECGLGISLYFYFFRFAFLVFFVGTAVLAISMMIFNHHYTKGIKRVCNNNYNKLKRNDLIFCEGFITVANVSLNVYSRFNDWILTFTSDNVEIYQLLHNNITSNSKNTKHVIINYSILNFCFLVTIFILNIFFIVFIYANSQKAKLLYFSIRDYTVLISNAKHILFEYLNTRERKNPKFLKSSQQLVENMADFISYVNEYIRSDRSLIDLKINNINLCYNLGSYLELRDEYEKCIKKIFKIKTNPTIIALNLKKGNLFENRCYYNIPLDFIGISCIAFKGKPLITLQKQKHDLKKQIEFEENNIQLITEQNFTGYMLVSFNRIKDKEIILKRYPNNFFDMIVNFFKHIKYYICCCCLSKGAEIKYSKIKGIDVDDPPEPEDIIWENFKYTSRFSILIIIGVFALCLIIIGLSFLLVLGFTIIQNKYIENDKNINLFIKYLLSLIISIIISVINYVFTLVLEYFTKKEKHLSRINYTLSLSIKLSILTFFNSAIIPLLSKHIIVKKKVMYDYNIDRNNLLVSDMLILFAINAIFTPLLWTFNFDLILRAFRIYLIERNKEPDKSHYMTQKQLNRLYELPDMKIAYKYSYIAKTLAMTFFYLPIFPIGFIISFVGMIFGYLLELYNFTHLIKRPDMLDEIISKVYADHFIIILFIGAIGDLFFFHDIFPNNGMSLANIIIFGILIIVPYTKFINCNFVGIEKSEYYDFPLSEVYLTFSTDYQRQNPFTKQVGLINYLTELKKNGYLSDNAYIIAEKNIENLNIMEIYYGISRGNIPIVSQSVMANTNNNKSIAGQNIRQSIVAPNIRDNLREKAKKQKYFDSQILNMFNSTLSKKIEFPIDFPMDTIIEEENDNAETKDKLINAYNNPLAINMGLGPLPMESSVHRSIPLTKSFRRLESQDMNKFKNNLKFSKYLDDKKDEDKNIVQDFNKSKSQYINMENKDKEIDKGKDKDALFRINENKNSIASTSKLDDTDSKHSLPFHNNHSNYNLDINNKFQSMGKYNENQNQPQNQYDENISKEEDNKEESESDKNYDIQYNSNMGINNEMPYSSNMGVFDFNNNNMNMEKIPQNEDNKIPLDSIENNENNNALNEGENNENLPENDNSDNYNNNSLDAGNHSQFKNSLINQNNNDTQSINDENLKDIFNTAQKKDITHTDLIQDTTTNKAILPLDGDSIKNSITSNYDLKLNINENLNDMNLSHNITNNDNGNRDIMDKHNFPYNNENNGNNNSDNERKRNETSNNDKILNSTLSNINSSKNGNDDYI